MDMASGKVYFWDSETNEVAWEPPPGATPRSKHANAATFAAHVSASDLPAAGTEPAAAQEAALPNASSHTAQASDTDGTDAPAAAASAADAAAAAADNDEGAHKQAGSLSDGSSAQTDRLSSEDREDGQPEVGSADLTPAAPSAQTGIAAPDVQLGALAQQMVDQIRQSTHSLCRNIPQLVRLAVEAEVRLQDWQMFSSKQQRAVDRSQPQESVSWTDIQDHMRWRWQSLQAALFGAVAEAKQLHARMDQELEAGEMPPLPSEDTAPPAQPPSDDSTMMTATDSVNPTLLLQPEQHNAVHAATADSQGAVTGTGAGLGESADALDPSEAPPLPAEDPSNPTTLAATAAPAAPSSIGAADHADDDADMELDMDVDAEAGTSASRPPSPDSDGQAASVASGAALPDWAGYYMAHGYAYPYYGEPHYATSSLCRCLCRLLLTVCITAIHKAESTQANTKFKTS